MKKFIFSKKFNIVWSVSAIALMWIVWAIVAVCVKNEYLVPDIASSMNEFFTLFASLFFWKALGATLLRSLIAFVISFIAAICFAVVSIVFKPFKAFMRPIVALLRTLPTMAVLLLILVWLSPRSAPVLVAVLVLFPMLYSQITEAIENVDGKVLEMAWVYKVCLKHKIFKIYLPQIAPSLVENIGSSLSFGLKITVSAEVMAATYTALGGLMSEAQVYINLPRLAALTLVAVIFGIIVECIFNFIARVSFKWRKEMTVD